MGEEEAAETVTETKPLGPRDLRVSDSEREHVVEVLQKAIGRGMLDLDEFTERTDRALAARTRGELNAVLADLAGLVHPAAALASVPNQYAPPAASYSRSGQPVVLQSKYGSILRNGPWLVPAELVVRNKYGGTKLDFSQADIPHPVVQIHLDSKWGSVEIIIPEGAAVDMNAIGEAKFGSLEDKTYTNGRQGNPLFVLSGRVHGGSVIVRHPRRGIFG